MKRDILKDKSDAEKANIVKRIMYLRKNILNLTQPAFAEAIGYSQTYVSLLEKGKRELTGDLIVNVAHTYNISEDWLLSGEGELFSPLAILNDPVRVLKFSYGLTSEETEYLMWFLSLSAEERSAVILLKDAAQALVKS